MRITQQLIAKHASVSQATVSRVLAGDDRVEPDIRDKVLQAVDHYNYKPDARARFLRTRSTELIGLALQRPKGGFLDDPFLTSLVTGIIERLHGSHYRLALQSINPEESPWAVYDEMLRTRSVDGLVLIESRANDERLLRLQRDKFPFVLIGNPLGNEVWSVDNDNVFAGEIATRHLWESGYRNIAFLGAGGGVTVSQDRADGYRKVAREIGFPERVFESDFGPESAHEASIEFLSTKAVDGVVVLDDFMAMGVVTAARKLGHAIPADLGIVSFNDSHICQMLEGGLSSVSLGLETLVAHAVDRLLALVKAEPDERPTRAIIPCELKVRGSSMRAGGLL